MGEAIKTRRGASEGSVIHYLYNEGDECAALTGSISVKNVQGTGMATVKNAGNISFTSSVATGYKLGSAYTTNPIDLTNYTKLKMLVEGITGTYPSYLGSIVSVCSNVPTANDWDSYLNAMTAKTRLDNTQTNATIELDITALNGSYYVFMNEGNSASLSNSVSATVTKLWLE